MLKIALPSGRIREQVTSLLHKAGIHLDYGPNDRSLMPRVSGADNLNFLVLRSKDAAGLVNTGQVDAAFLGGDMLDEVGGTDLREQLLDTGADPVKLVIAGKPTDRDDFQAVSNGESDQVITIATKYPRLVADWCTQRNLQGRFQTLPVEGSVEVFAYLNDGMLIADVTASGETLRSNGLVVLDEMRTSTTVFVANKKRMEDSEVRQALELIAYLLRGVIQAEDREMLSVNASLEVEAAVAAILAPASMQTVDRTVAANGKSVSLRIAVRRKEKFQVLKAIREAGGTDPVIQPITLLA